MKQVVVGIDEVGRGAWAGPLLVGAVILSGPAPEGVTDSKLLSAKRRVLLARSIKSQAIAIGLGWVTAAELDSIGLSPALTLAAARAVAALRRAHQAALAAFGPGPQHRRCFAPIMELERVNG
jgi:ribonuclease HII